FEDLQLYQVTQISMEPLLTSDRLQISSQRNPAAAANQAVFSIATQVTGGSIPAGGSIVSQPFDAQIAATLENLHSVEPKAWAALLRDWQRSGGRFDVTKAQFQQGESIASASGVLSLNAAGRVDGNLRVGTTGAYVQLAQSFLRNEPGGAAQRENIAQSMLGGTKSRSLGKAQQTEEELRKEAAQREALGRAERQRTQTPPTGQGLELPLRFTDGAIYLDTTRLGEIPPLF
ncbi:MAG: DUF2125 domain-containing protein, partial [Pseudorhodoplanes sp.]|nr:DUF2125 domain-containing protein [Pseudorhodoplanes sp.]